MIRKSLIIIFILSLLLALSCKKAKPGFDKRSFLLGVTPWPPDFTKKGYDLAYDFIKSDCDMVSHHFDDGVPWEEIYKGLPMPKNLQEDLDRRKQKTPAGKKVLLSVAPLKISRTERTGYYSKPENQGYVDAWEHRSFRDSSVISAYVLFIDFLIKELHADYINYGVESNSNAWKKENFEDYKYFLSQVKARLNTLYPDKPFFLSFMVHPDAGFLDNAKQLEPYTDWISISAYPYSYIGSPVHGSSSPSLIPDHLFQSFADINSAKPFAVAETGYIAEDLTVTGVTKEGTPQWQEDYVNYLFKFCENNHAKFIIWFCAYDYDDATNTFNAIGSQMDLTLLWKDTGLLNERLEGRPALQAWRDWRKLQIE